jgi:hypothetical protein
MKKKKTAIVITIILVLVLCISAITITILYPHIILKNRVNDIMDSDYSYKIEYIVSGMDEIVGNKKIVGTVNGTKSGDTIKGSVNYMNTRIFDIYANIDSEIVFDVKPLFKELLRQAGEYTDIPIGLLSFGVDNTYISLEQLENIIGMETSDNSNMSLENIFKECSISLASPNDRTRDVFLNNETNDYRLTFEERELSIYLSIPTNERIDCIYACLESENLTIDIVFTYEKTNTDPIQLPTDRVSNITIKILEKIFDVWKETFM